jgi:two-component system, chemotaxis family, chemotaxis protein CheY
MKILVIDDSRTARLATGQILQELGYADIVFANNYEEAVSLVQKTEPGLIFSDVNMPGKSGIDFLKYVRTSPKLSKIPFIIFTMYNEQKSIFEAVKLGVQDYMVKPLDKEIVCKKLLALSKSHGIEPPPRQNGCGK